MKTLMAPASKLAHSLLMVCWWPIVMEKGEDFSLAVHGGENNWCGRGISAQLGRERGRGGERESLGTCS